MEKKISNLGVCFFSGRMLYSVAEKGAKNIVQQLGSYEFSFDISEALNKPTSDAGIQLKAVFTDLEKEFHLESIRLLTEPTQECWTALPKIVYDDSVKIYGEQRSVYINGDMKKIKNIFKNIPGHFLEKQEIESLIGLPNDDERNNFFPEHVFLLDDGHIIFPNHLSANLRGYHGGLTPKEVAIPLIEIVS